MRNQLIVLLILIISTVGCKTSENKEQKEIEPEKITDSHNSRNSLDWSGTYRGTLPCADCEGILIEIQLHQDSTYDLARKYKGESEEVLRQSGSFKWDNSGNKITLITDEQSETNQYQVGENQLIKLDVSGKRIQSEFSEMYSLKKLDFDQKITEKYWKLIELRGEKISVNENQQREAHFILKEDNNRVTGHGGCNFFNGSYQLGAHNQVEFSQMVSTRMACMDITYEGDYLKIFEIADNYTIKDDTLSLNKARMAPLAKFVSVYF